MQYQLFTVREDHLKLLRRFCVGWQDCETGAPEIDPKRPYGNSSVEEDIHEILTGERRELSDEERDNYYNLHRETEKVLQIVLSTGSFKAGNYKCESYCFRWMEV
jgi:hypothetical protein